MAHQRIGTIRVSHGMLLFVDPLYLNDWRTLGTESSSRETLTRFLQKQSFGEINFCEHKGQIGKPIAVVVGNLPDGEFPIWYNPADDSEIYLRIDFPSDGEQDPAPARYVAGSVMSDSCIFFVVDPYELETWRREDAASYNAVLVPNSERGDPYAEVEKGWVFYDYHGRSAGDPLMYVLVDKNGIIVGVEISLGLEEAAREDESDAEYLAELTKRYGKRENGT